MNDRFLYLVNTEKDTPHDFAGMERMLIIVWKILEEIVIKWKTFYTFVSKRESIKFNYGQILRNSLRKSG